MDSKKGKAYAFLDFKLKEENLQELVQKKKGELNCKIHERVAEAFREIDDELRQGAEFFSKELGIRYVIEASHDRLGNEEVAERLRILINDIRRYAKEGISAVAYMNRGKIELK